jgi:Family of unknown function (DUF5372)
MADSAHSRSPRLRRIALTPGQPLGFAEITHPFHPLRGQRFVVLRIKEVTGVARQACIYIRQSTPGQVRFNQESKERQYNLANQAKALGARPDHTNGS